MDSPEMVELLRAEGDGLLAAALEAPHAPIPTAPGWDMADLLRHVCLVHRWSEETVRTGSHPRRRDVPAPAEGSAVEDMITWYRDGLDALCATLTEAGPAQEVWTFSIRGDTTAAWWTRRQACETAVHRWDAEHAAGADRARALPAALAAAGIAEYLLEFLPGAMERQAVTLAGTLHLHATDAEAEWLVDFDATPPACRQVHAKAGTAVRGPVSDLMLWLWNRLAAGGSRLEVFGDPAPVTAWPSFAI